MNNLKQIQERIGTACDLCNREIPEGELRTVVMSLHGCKNCVPISLWKRIKFKLFL